MASIKIYKHKQNHKTVKIHVSYKIYNYIQRKIKCVQKGLIEFKYCIVLIVRGRVLKSQVLKHTLNLPITLGALQKHGADQRFKSKNYTLYIRICLSKRNAMEHVSINCRTFKNYLYLFDGRLTKYNQSVEWKQCY